MRASTMQLALVALLLCAAGTAAAQTMNGHWVNRDANTGKRIGIVSVDISGTQIHPYGNCVPTSCDWGVIETRPAGQAGLLMGEANQGFADRRIEVSMQDGATLKMWINTHFLDNSGRADYTSVEFFHREVDQGVIEAGPDGNPVVHQSQAAGNVQGAPAVLLSGALDGEWKNVDPSTRYLKRIIVSGSTMHPYASCGGGKGECDWGILPAQRYAAGVGSRDCVSMMAIYEKNSINNLLAVTLESDGRLRVQGFTTFSPADGRSNYSVVNFFQR